MLKSPITKTGEVRYVEVIKYAILIALFSYGYVLLANSSFIYNLFLGFNKILFLTSVFTGILISVNVIQFVNILKAIIAPIIKHIKKQLSMDFESSEIVFIESDEPCLDNKIFSRLRVIRC